MQVAKLQKVGEAVMLAIPPAMLVALSLDDAALVGIAVDGGKLIVTPSKRKRYSLEELMDQCDLDAPESEDMAAWRNAPAVGREAI